MTTIAWDFDGVIHPYTRGWTGYAPDDEPPIEGVRELMRDLYDEGYRLVVMSARCDHDDGHAGISVWMTADGLIEYVDEITNVKVPALAYIDDRGITYNGDWDAVRAQIDRLAKHGPNGPALPNEIARLQDALAWAAVELDAAHAALVAHGFLADSQSIKRAADAARSAAEGR